MNPAPLLLHVFSTFRIGGPQVRFAALANRFGGKYRHAILAMDGAYDCWERLGSDVAAAKPDVEVRKKQTARNLVAFRRALGRLRPDVLVTYNWGAIEWALANRPRIASHIHIEDGFGPDEAEHQLFRRSLARCLVLRASTVVLPSRTLLEIARRNWHLPRRRLRWIPNGIDCARFGVRRMPIALPSGAGPVVGTLAALRKEKNIERLVRAVHRVRATTPCRLVIAGDGPERPHLESLARELLPGDSFVFTGPVDDIEAIYASLDVFALSSDTEQMPTSLMEAMAAGLPAVVTNVGDAAEMISEANAPFVASRDGSAFADALCALLGDPAARQRIGELNKAKANAQFGIARMAADYDALFSAALVRPAA